MCASGPSGGTAPCTTLGPFIVNASNTVDGPGPLQGSTRYWQAPLPNSFAAPSGQSHCRITITGMPAAPNAYQIYQAGTGLTVLNAQGQGTNFSIDGDLPPGHLYECVFSGGTTHMPHTALLEFWNSTALGEGPCGSGTTSPAPPPPAPPAPPSGFPLPPVLSCATIPDICAALTAISRNLDHVKTAVDLVQRYRLPFAYVPGTRHRSLTGTGSFFISGLVGLQVYVTTPPPGRPILEGNPPYLFDVGWMSLNDSSGMLQEKRITRSGFDWIAEDAQLATSFNYALNPGVVVDVVELRPEP